MKKHLFVKSANFFGALWPKKNMSDLPGAKLTEDLNVWHWILDKWYRFRARRRARRALAPENLRVLTQDVKEIALLSGMVWSHDQGLQDRVRKICQDMDQLNRLLDKSSFKRLPEDKKRELHSSLLVSREELLKGLQSAPCPTDKIQ